MSVGVQYDWIAETLASDAIQADRRVRRHDNAVVWVPAVILLGVLAVALLWYPLLRPMSPTSIAYNEGWQTLSEAPSGLTIANYPLLLFHLIGFLGGLAGDISFVGRAVALVSLALVCLLTGMIAARFSGSRLAGWYAGLCPLVWLGVFSPLRFAVNDPQWLGMVPEFLGLYLYLRKPSSVSGLCGAAALCALAVFTNDNLIAVPVAVGLHLVLLRDWRRLGIFAGAGVVASGVLLAATVAVDGPFFPDHVLHARAESYEAAQHTIMTYAMFFPAAILVGGIWCVQHIRTDRYRLLALCWMVANALGVGVSFGHGVANNMMFEALVFDAIVVAVACQAFLARHERRRSGMLLVLNAVWPVVLLPAALTDGPHEWEMLGGAKLAFSAGADAVRVDPGPGSPALPEADVTALVPSYGPWVEPEVCA
jgi:hypothetical protein